MKSRLSCFDASHAESTEQAWYMFMIPTLDLMPDEIPVFAQVQRGALDLWVDACASIFEVSPVARDAVSEEYQVSAWFVEPLTFSRSGYQSMVNRHSRWHVEEAGQQLFVHRYNHGGATLEVAGNSIDCEPGGITILDYARPFQSIHAASECDGVFIPHSAIGFDPMHCVDMRYFEAGSLIAELIGRELDQMIEALEAGAPFILQKDVDRLLGCVECAMSAKAASKSAWAQANLSLREMIKTFIERNLMARELSVDLILSNFALSRARLYRLFEAESGVRNYITRRRLQKAVFMIADNPLKRGQIRAVSERCGFSSEVAFNRAVKRIYGTSPGTLFEMPLRHPDYLHPRSILQTLMDQASHSNRAPELQRSPALV